MSYTKFNTNNGIEFIPLEKPEQIDQINIEAQPQNNFSELTNSDTICCICLENNNLTNTQLNCRCNAIMHKKCIEEMCKKKLTNVHCVLIL